MSLVITITITQAAAAADPMSITYNGYQYKTLASHNPHSAQVINEYGQTLYDQKVFNLDSSWHLCPRTPDALHVCATHPWQSYALVFADGSAHFTQCAPSDPSYKTGMAARGSGCLVQKEGKYASLVGGMYTDPKRCYSNSSEFKGSSDEDDDACGGCGGCDRGCTCLICGAQGYSSRDCYKDHSYFNYCSDVLIRRKQL
jgi:hypothetical protein